MPLKAVLASKAEVDALPEALRGFYVEQDGKFVLDADVDAHPKVGGLKSALDKERGEKDKAAKEFKALKDKIGDMDPEKAREALKRIQELEDKKLLDEGKVEELIQARTDRMKKDHESQVTAFQTQLKEKDTRISTLGGRLRTLVLDGSIRDEALKAGVKPEHVEDVISRMTMRGIDGVRWDLEDDEKIVAKAGDQIKFGKDATKPMPIGEGLELLREKVPGFFAASSGGGAQSGARQVGNAFVISAEDAKDPNKYRAAREQATKAGQPLQIAAA